MIVFFIQICYSANLEVVFQIENEVVLYPIYQLINQFNELNQTSI